MGASISGLQALTPACPTQTPAGSGTPVDAEDRSLDLKEYLVECGRGNTEIPEGGHLVDGGDPTAEV